VDPVDPWRNVASPVSAQTLAHTARCARSLIAHPSIELFHPFSGRPNDLDNIVIDGLAPIGPSIPLVCPLPEANSSMAVTQLRRVLNTCISALEREGFGSVSVELCLIFPKGWAIDQGYTRTRWTFVTSRVEAPLVALRVVTDPAELGPTKEHWGPPIDNERAPDFRARWGDRTRQDDESGRLYTIVQRARTRSADLLRACWSENARGLFRGSVLDPPTDKMLERSLASVLGT
jgi:tRNA nucleotidyltransferase (CCA-adding enzyme)